MLSRFQLLPPQHSDISCYFSIFPVVYSCFMTYPHLNLRNHLPFARRDTQHLPLRSLQSHVAKSTADLKRWAERAFTSLEHSEKTVLFGIPKYSLVPYVAMSPNCHHTTHRWNIDSYMITVTSEFPFRIAKVRTISIPQLFPYFTQPKVWGHFFCAGFPQQATLSRLGLLCIGDQVTVIHHGKNLYLGPFPWFLAYQPHFMAKHCTFHNSPSYPKLLTKPPGVWSP